METTVTTVPAMARLIMSIASSTIGAFPHEWT
jgi:hypothetical protein